MYEKILKIPEKQETGQFLEYHASDEVIKTQYVESLVTTFTGTVPTPPILNISDPQKMSSYFNMFKRNFDYAIDLHKNGNSEFVQQVQYYQMNERYSIGNYEKELPICIVAPGRNLVSHDFELKFLRSIEHQNYTNFRLFIIDDASTDNTY